MPKGLRLYKKEKLCSPTVIERLFKGERPDFRQLAYPLRAVAVKRESGRSDAPVCFLVSVPKRRVRHAVERVLVRRRVREAYRLNHQNYAFEGLTDVAFIYVADVPLPYATIERAMQRLLQALSESVGRKDGEEEQP